MSKKIFSFALVLASTAFYFGCTADGVKGQQCWIIPKGATEPVCLPIDDMITTDFCSSGNGLIINDCDNPPQLQFCYNGVMCLVINSSMTIDQCYDNIGGIAIDNCNYPPKLQYCYRQISEGIICRVIGSNLTAAQCTGNIGGVVIDDCANPPPPPTQPPQYCVIGGSCQMIDSMLCALSGGVPVDSCPSTGN